MTSHRVLLLAGFAGLIVVCAGTGAFADPARVPTPSKGFDLWRRKASHWAWQPVRPQPAPAVKDRQWAKSPVDAFVLAKLEAADLPPAPPADRRTLIRRLSFALTGLPPAPDEVDAFLNDASPGATEKVVDRLLASPHFGERWARHWMDLVRYSDTLGNEADMPVPNAWRYRDYLIRAFNADVPYDRLVLEHVAGDLLPSPRQNPEGDSKAGHFNESVIGTGFFWMAEGKRSPVDLRLAQAEAFDNRLDVMCKTFLGLTVACARCHDHKFDAISASDYYALYGYLKSSRYTQAMLNKSDLGAAAARLAASRSQIRRSAARVLAQRVPEFIRRMKEDEPTATDAGDASHPLYPWRRVADLGAGATPDAVAARWREVESELESRAAADEAARRRKDDVELADFSAGGFGGWTAEDQAFGAGALRPGDFLLGKDAGRPVGTFVRAGGWAHSAHLSRRLQGTLRSAEFTIDRRFLHVYAAGRASRVNVIIEQFVMIQDPLYGSLRRVLDSDSPAWLTFDLSMWKGRRAYVEIADTTTPDLHDMKPPAGCGPEGYAALGRVVLSDQGPPAAPPPVAGTALRGAGPISSATDLADRYAAVVHDSLRAFGDGTLPDKPDADARAALLAWLVERGLPDTGPGGERDAATLESLFKELAEAEAKLPEPARAAALTEGTPQDEYVFVRGDPKLVGPVAPRRMLQAIAGPASEQPAPPPGGSGRLWLARQIASPDNPLTARVAVNRVWHHLFGRGLVASVDNFGALGDRPTHPELLDDLADRFVKEGWSLKKLVRALVLTSTFRMSSRASAEFDSVDPDNRLLHRMPVRRLEAEAIRDSILAVSGRLERTAFGPPVEVHLTPFMDNNYGDDYGRPKSSGPLDGAGRRSVYLMVRRNFLNPMLMAFDMPPPLNTTGRRAVSNVPAQALTLMNDPFVAGQAQVWAKRVLGIPGLDPAGRVRQMYLEAYARPPSERELATALRFLDRQRAERGEDAGAWSDLAQLLINVKEFIYLN